MLVLEDVLISVRQVPLPANRIPTERQSEAVEQLGLGPPPADLTFAEAGAILTARSVAREVLHQLSGTARINRVIRLQLEPYIIHFITSDPHLLSEVMQRNQKRLSFCKKGDTPPSHETRTKVFGEARRLVKGAPYATHSVLRTPRRTYQRNHRSPVRRYGAHLGVQHTRPSSFILRLLKVLIFGRSTNPSIDDARCSQISPDEEPSLIGMASVIDGDTLEIHGERVRIWGIDAPEDGQLGIKNGKPWRCGQECALALADFLGSHAVACFPRDYDEFNRVVARCEVRGHDVGAWMVRSGWALDYQQYSNGRYADAQAQAKKAGCGLWQGEFELPWKWRVRARWLAENHSVPCGQFLRSSSSRDALPGYRSRTS